MRNRSRQKNARKLFPAATARPRGARRPHRLKKKLIRQVKTPTVMGLLAKYVPMAAVICAGIYLPPKLLSSIWINDADSNWNNAANWGPGGSPSSSGIPTTPAQSAFFSSDYSITRNVTLDISTSVGTVTLDDPVPQESLNIVASGSNSFLLSAPTNGSPYTSGTFFNAYADQTLTVNPILANLNGSTAGQLVINNGNNVNGNGMFPVVGVVVLTNAANSYTGATVVNGGVLSVANLGLSGSNSAIGASTNGAGNLVLNNGTLRYTGGSTTTDHAFTIGADVQDTYGNLLVPGGTLDASGTGTGPGGGVVFSNTGSIAFSATGTSNTLVLRGTNTANNELDAFIGNNTSGATTLLKTDPGTWQITADYANGNGNGNGVLPTPVANSYTGPTIIEQGTLQLNYNFGTGGQGGTKGTQRLPISTQLELGSLAVLNGSNPGYAAANGQGLATGRPGGGTLDLYNAQPQYSIASGFPTQLVGGISVLPGSNAINASAWAASSGASLPVIYVGSLDNVNAPGATLSLQLVNSAALSSSLSPVLTTSQPGDVIPGSDTYGGWIYVGDDWATFSGLAAGTVSGTNVYQVIRFTSYTQDISPYQWLAASVPYDIDVSIYPPATGQDPYGFTHDPVDAGSDGTFLTYSNINSLHFNGGQQKQLTILDGTCLYIATGGILMASGTGATEIAPLALPTAFQQPGAPTNSGSISTPNEALYIINRSTAGLYIGTAIIDDPVSGNAVSVTKDGPGTVYLQAAAPNGSGGFQYNSYSGNTYINLGTLAIRANQALGVPGNSTANGPAGSPFTGEDALDDYVNTGNAYINGGILDFQNVNYTSQKTIVVYAEPAGVTTGYVQDSLGHSYFDGYIYSANPDAQTIINTTTAAANFLTLGVPGLLGSLNGVSGFEKIGAGTLVINSPIDVVPLAGAPASAYPGVADLTLTAGDVIVNGSVTLTTGSVNITGGQASFAGPISTPGGRFIVNAGLVSIIAGPTFTYSSDLTLTVTGTSGSSTILGGLSGTGTQTFTRPVIVTGSSSATATLTTNGSETFTGGLLLNQVNSNFTEIANVIPTAIPTNTFSTNPVNFLDTGGTVTFNYGNSILTPVTVGSATNAAGTTLTINGIGVTTFGTNSSLTLVNAGTSLSTVNLTNTTFSSTYGTGGNYVVMTGNSVFNGLDTVAGQLQIYSTNSTTGSFSEGGTRRTASAYGVQNTYAGGVLIDNTSAFAMSLTFQDVDSIGQLTSGAPNITIQGIAPSFAGFANTTAGTYTTAVNYNNAQSFTGTSPAFDLEGGAVTIGSSNAFGASALSVNVGVSGLGEKSALLLQHGISTDAAATLDIGYTTGYISGLVVTSSGSGLAATITVAGGTTNAIFTEAASGALTSVTTTNVGAGYTTVPTVTLSGSATAAAVMSGVIALRTTDEHNIWGGSIVLNNVSSGGQLSVGAPLLSVDANGGLEIEGNIYGGSTAVNSPTGASRLLTTAIVGNPYNSSSGFIILDGQVEDTIAGPSTSVGTQLRTEWAGNQALNIFVNNTWDANGLISLEQGVMRFTANNTSSNNFFASTVTPSFQLSVPFTSNTSAGWNLQSQNIAFFLTKANQDLNISGFSVYDGNTNDLTTAGTPTNLTGASTGNTTIGGENASGAVTIGLIGTTNSNPLSNSSTLSTGKITLVTDSASQNRDLRLYANTGGTVYIAAAIVDGVGTESGAAQGTGSITKIGGGTVVLLGNTTTAGNANSVYISGGTLEFAGFDATGSQQRVSTAAKLNLNGGALAIENTFTASGTFAQSLSGGVNILAGGSAVYVMDNDSGNAGKMTLTIGGAVSRSVGGTVAFSANGTATADKILFPNSSSLAASKPLGFTTYGTSASPTSSVAAIGFAEITSGTNVVGAFTGSTVIALTGWTSTTGNYAEGSTGAGFSGTMPTSETAVNTFAFTSSNATTGAGIVTIPTGNTLQVDEGILVSSNAGGVGRVITGGSITNSNTSATSSTGYGDLIIENYGVNHGGTLTGATLTIQSTITNNGTGSNAVPKGLTISGPGTTILAPTTGANTFGGPVSGSTVNAINVYINNGTVMINADADLGYQGLITGTTTTAGNGIYLNGGTLDVTGSGFVTSRNITVYGSSSTIQVASGDMLTLTGNILSQANVLGANQTGTNSFDGDLVLTGGGTIYQSTLVNQNIPLSSGSATPNASAGTNTYTGQLTINDGTTYIYEGVGSSYLGTASSAMHQTTVTGGATFQISPTTGNDSNNGWFSISGAGVGGEGALLLSRANATPNGAGSAISIGSLVDRTVTFNGPVSMTASATIGVNSSPTLYSSTFGSVFATTSLTGTGATSNYGVMLFSDDVFDGGGAGNSNTLTKVGNGVLEFQNAQVQNLTNLQINAGVVRFDTGVTGTIGSATNASALPSSIQAILPTGFNNNFYSGTNSIVVGTGAGGTESTSLSVNPMLWFDDSRGVNTANVTLQGGFFAVFSSAAPLQPVSLGGTITIAGPTSSNAIELNGYNGGGATSPTVDFGPINGSSSSGFYKMGLNELQLVNPNSNFAGTMIIARGGNGLDSPSVGIYDGGVLPAGTIELTNDATLNIDDRDVVGAFTGNTDVNHLSTSTVLNLTGFGRVRFIGGTSSTTYSEAVGQILVGEGSTAIEMDPGYSTTDNAYENISMSAASYNRLSGGIVQFRVLEPGVTWGAAANPPGTNYASMTIGTMPASSLYIGGAGPTTGTNEPILIGAFGGVATQSAASLQAGTVALALNNNEQLYVARNFMTIQSVNGVLNLRPLAASEYFTASATQDPNNPLPQYVAAANGNPAAANTGTSVYTFDSSAANQNVRLIGGFGPWSSNTSEASYGSELNGPYGTVGATGYQAFVNDASERQDSTYLVNSSMAVNSLSFAASTTVNVSDGGNRIILELNPGAVLTVTSGMIENAGMGVVTQADPNTSDVSDQRVYIRGGTLEFGSQQIIINNVGATYHQDNGTWATTDGDMNIYSTLDGTGGLLKSGNSIVLLGGNNTYSGTTYDTEGVLRLVSSGALGNSQLMVVSGTGDFRLEYGVSIGTLGGSSNPTLLFTNQSITNEIRGDAGNNIWAGDIQIDCADASGERVFSTNIVSGANGELEIGGNIYGVGTSPLSSNVLGSVSRIVDIEGGATGSVIKLLGTFSDTASGPISTMINSSNEDQVLRALFTNNANTNYLLYKSWNSAGSVIVREGYMKVMPTVTNFYTTAAMNSLNALNGQSHPIIGDTTGSDAAIMLTAPLQNFNSPTLWVGSGSGTTDTASFMIGGENTSGTVYFLNPNVTTGVVVNGTTTSGSKTITVASNNGFTVGEVIEGPGIPAGETVASISGNSIGLTLAVTANGSTNVSLTAPAFNSAVQETSVWDHDVRLFANTGGTVEVWGRITDSGTQGGIDKIGSGTVIMRGMDDSSATVGWTAGTVTNGVVGTVGSNINNFSRQVIAAGGTLELDYNTNNVIEWGANTASLVLAGGQIELLGNSQQTVNQYWGSTSSFTVRPGNSEIDLLPASNGTPINLTITGQFLQLTGTNPGGTTPSSAGKNGGTVNFVVPPVSANTGSITFNTIVSSVTIGSTVTTIGNIGGASQMLGPWATYSNTPNTVNDFAALNAAGQVVPLGTGGLVAETINDNPSTWGAGQYYITDDASGFTNATVATGANVVVKDILMTSNNSNGSTLNLPTGFVLGTGVEAGTTTTAATDEGAILIPSSVTVAKVIQGGSISVPDAKDLIIHNYGTGGLTINSVIQDYSASLGSTNTASTSSGSTTVALTSTAGLVVGETLAGAGIPANDVISSISGNNVVLASAPTATATGVTLTVSAAGQNVVYSGTGTTTLGSPSGSQTITIGNTTTPALVTPINTYTGKTFINGGTLIVSQLSTNGSIGADPTAVVADNLNINGGTLVFYGETLKNDPDFNQNAQVTNPVNLGNAAFPVPNYQIPNGTGVLSVNRGIVIGASGATFNVQTPTLPAIQDTQDLVSASSYNSLETVTINGIIGSVANPALQGGSATTLGGSNAPAFLARNSFVGNLIKTGNGTLALASANTYSGLTDIQQGTLEVLTNSTNTSGSNSALGTNVSMLDGTIVEAGATLEFGQTQGTLTSNEWLDLKGTPSNPSNITLNYVTSNQSVALDAPINVEGTVDINYTGGYLKTGSGTTATVALAAPSGASTVIFGSSGGYLYGSGTIVKNTVYDGVNGATTGSGGILSFNQSNPEWTGGLVINGGLVYVRSIGTPLGVGTTPIQLGTTGNNQIITSPGANQTAPTDPVFYEANLYFAAVNVTVDNGAATYSGAPDSVSATYQINQSIVVNKPSNGFQYKLIGIINATSPFEQYNFGAPGTSSTITLNDDLYLFTQLSALNANAGGQHINFNLNDNLVTGNPNVSPGVSSAGNIFTATNFSGTLLTSGAGINLTSNGQTSFVSSATAYPPLFVDYNINGNNSRYSGSFSVGSTTMSTTFNGGPLLYTNPDQVPGVNDAADGAVNAVFHLNSNYALNANTPVTLKQFATIQVEGNNVVMGALTGEQLGTLSNGVGVNDLGPTQFLPGVSAQAGNTSQIVGGNTAIIENASSNPGTLTITQQPYFGNNGNGYNPSGNSTWDILFRDGVTSTGAAAAPLTIIKSGPSIAQFDEGNLYTGGTIIQQGILNVENINPDPVTGLPTSATGTGVVKIGPNGTLAGDGYISGAVQISGTIHPGRYDAGTGVEDSGILNLSGAVTFLQGGTLRAALLGSNIGANGFSNLNLLNATSVSFPNNSITLSVYLNPQLFLPTFDPQGNPAGGEQFDILDSPTPIPTSLIVYGSVPAIPIGGNFNVYYPDATVPGQIDEQIFQVTIGGPEMNSIILIAVPEPGTIATMLSGVGMLLGLQRFRRRQRRSA